MQNFALKLKLIKNTVLKNMICSPIVEKSVCFHHSVNCKCYQMSHCFIIVIPYSDKGEENQHFGTNLRTLELKKRTENWSKDFFCLCIGESFKGCNMDNSREVNNVEERRCKSIEMLLRISLGQV